MNLFWNESHSDKMKTVPKVESQAALYGSSLKLELYESRSQSKDL